MHHHTNSGRRRLTALLGTVASIAVIGYITLSLGSVDHARAGSTATAAQEPTLSVPIAGQAYSVAYDPFRSAIWYVVMQPSSTTEPPQSPPGTASPGTTPETVEANLYEADAATGQITKSFAIPNPNHDSGLSDIVAVAPDKSVWVAESYAIYRVDPTDSHVETLNLPETVPGSLDTPNQGTFVTSMTFTSDSALIGRNNLSLLQQVSLSLKPLPDLSLPNGTFAPSSMTTTRSSVEMVAPTTSSPGSVAGQRASVQLPATTSAADGPNGMDLAPQYLLVRPDRVTAELRAFDGRAILAIAGPDHVLTWSPDTSRQLTLSWPRTSGEITNPLGQQVEVASWPQLEAAVELPDKHLWLAAATASGAVLELFTAS